MRHGEIRTKKQPIPVSITLFGVHFSHLTIRRPSIILDKGQFLSTPIYPNSFILGVTDP